MRDILYELNGVRSAFHPILSVIYGCLEIQDLMSLAVYIQQQQQQQHHQLGQQQQQQHKQQQQQSSYLHYFIQEKILYNRSTRVLDFVNIVTNFIASISIYKEFVTTCAITPYRPLDVSEIYLVLSPEREHQSDMLDLVSSAYPNIKTIYIHNNIAFGKAVLSTPVPILSSNIDITSITGVDNIRIHYPLGISTKVFMPAVRAVIECDEQPPSMRLSLIHI